MDLDWLEQSLAERRGRREHRQLPKRYQDMPARKAKHLNLDTYTYHALGDYVATIRHFGTTDSYSTQQVSL